MDVLLERLDAKLREWEPDTAEQVRQRTAEIIREVEKEQHRSGAEAAVRVSWAAAPTPAVSGTFGLAV